MGVFNVVAYRQITPPEKRRFYHSQEICLYDHKWVDDGDDLTEIFSSSWELHCDHTLMRLLVK